MLKRFSHEYTWDFRSNTLINGAIPNDPPPQITIRAKIITIRENATLGSARFVTLLFWFGLGMALLRVFRRGRFKRVVDHAVLCTVKILRYPQPFSSARAFSSPRRSLAAADCVPSGAAPASGAPAPLVRGSLPVKQTRIRIKGVKLFINLFLFL